ncbi:LOW QUALITY PROTEIN: hypothetical protein ACHAXT_006198 [Thalassiosira profunda]
MTKQSHSIAGSITAGCFSTPLDTIKVHQQTNPRLSKTNLVGAVHHLASGDARRLFRGIGPPMANQIVMNSVMFTVFNKVKDAASESTLLNENAASFVAGLFSGFATACISTPTDWFKIQAQMSLANNHNAKRPTRYDNMMSMLRRNIVKDGKLEQPFNTLFRGHVANLGREGVFTMVYLGMYDRITQAVKERNGNASPGMGTVVLISSFTGGLAWIANYPFDCVKTVMHKQDRHNTNEYQEASDAINLQLWRMESVLAWCWTVYIPRNACHI